MSFDAPEGEGDPVFNQGTRAAWDLSAARYDLLYGHGIRSTTELGAWRSLVRRVVSPGLGPLRVLDVGAGTGALALLFAEAGHVVTALDYSTAMLAQLARKADDSGLAIDIVHSSADLENLKAGSYDLIVCRHLIWALESPEITMACWRERINPGGKFVAVEQLRLSVSRPRQIARDLADALHPIMGAGDAHDGDFPEVPGYLQPLKHIQTPEPAVNALRRAGFEHVQAERLTWLDDVERRAMPSLERWGRRWNRYLLEAWDDHAHL